METLVNQSLCEKEISCNTFLRTKEYMKSSPKTTKHELYTCEIQLVESKTRTCHRPVVRRFRPPVELQINRYLAGRCDFPSVPKHALHEKALQRQGVGPPISSREQRALLVPRVNRGSTGCGQVATGSYKISLVRAFGKTFKTHFFDVVRSSCFVGVPATPFPAVPPCAPT